MRWSGILFALEAASGMADLLLRMQVLYGAMIIRARAGRLNVRRYQPERV